MILCGNPNIFEDFGNLNIVFVRWVFFDADHFQFSKTIIGRIILKVARSVQGLFFFDRIIETLVSKQNCIGDGKIFKCKLILPQNTHLQSWFNRNITFVIFDFTTQNIEKSGFSSPICSDKTVSFVSVQFEINSLKKDATSEAHC